MEERYTGILEANGGCEIHHITSFEKVLGFKLPPDYREFLLHTNGGDAKSNSVPFGVGVMREETSIRAFYGLKSDSEAGDLLHCYSLQVEGKTGPRNCLPIAYDDGGWTFLIYLDGTRAGEVWLKDSEWELHFVAGDFRSFMESVIVEVSESDDGPGDLTAEEPKVYSKAEWARIHGRQPNSPT